ncbi:uncharacterized protein LOC126843598 isoform X3 [Adelges cooleyi]|uniref:uncharacterized protein LOC126843598 isoform X3 n=1 Tax=Adelges cooleyi TaxID=133065 RepID=UPI00217F7FED|nr:uncharacterized protein LOC126843598 isoform X3 [Adelges cooleyi]
MMRFGILTKTVVGLILFVYTSVRSLETGYKYTNEHVEQGELYMDLKCGYLFGGYTQETRNTTEYHPKIVETLIFVIKQLDDDLAGCRKGSLFDTYDIVLSKGVIKIYTIYASPHRSSLRFLSTEMTSSISLLQEPDKQT